MTADTFMIIPHEIYAVGLGLELATPELQITHAVLPTALLGPADCIIYNVYVYICSIPN